MRGRESFGNSNTEKMTDKGGFQKIAVLWCVHMSLPEYKDKKRNMRHTEADLHMRMGAATPVKLLYGVDRIYKSEQILTTFHKSLAAVLLVNIMATLCFLLGAILILQVGRACDVHAEEDLLVSGRHSGDFLVKNYEMIPDTWNAHRYYPMRPLLPDYNSLYESRTPFTRPPLDVINPFKKYLFKSDAEEEKTQAENRFLLGLFNNRFPSANTWRPFANLPNRFPISYNPNFNNPYTIDSCQSPSGESGICTPGSVCSLFGGRPSGSCSFGKVCCINYVTGCSGTVTLNNTYWQSPSTGVSAPSTCVLKIQPVTNKVVEPLLKPICQIRLDFVTFSTAQPTAGTCTDTFTIAGTTTVVPVICGENGGQHMYLDVPSSSLIPTDVQLIFNFVPGIATRFWNIKVALLPCGATYLAPADCLQYFTTASGRVKSFNWQDVAGTGTRQLNNQNYNICFRTELVSSQRTTQMCLSVCGVSNGGDAFSITTPTSTDAAAAAAAVVTATTNLANAKTTLTNAQATLATAQTALVNAQTALTIAQNNIAPTQAALTAAQDALVTAQAAATIAETALTTAQGVLTNAQTALTTAQGTLTDAQTALTTAQTDLNNANAAEPPDAAAIAAAQAAVDAAQTAVNDAQAAFDGAQTTVTNAQTDVNNAQTAFDNAQTAVTDAQTAVVNAQIAADNAQTAVNDAQTAVNNAQTDVFNAQAAVTDAQTAVGNAQAALTAAQVAAANAAASAASLSGVGASAIVNGVNTATCLYDFLLIAGARDSTNVEADRFCGNALNPAINPVTTSVSVCTSIKPFKMTYRTDGTEGVVAAGVNVLPAPADSGNVGFCLDYQEK